MNNTMIEFNEGHQTHYVYIITNKHRTTYYIGMTSNLGRRLKEYKENIEYSENEYEAVTGADATIIVTEWNQFRGMNLRKMKELMKDNYLFDLRNIHGKNPEVRSLFKYYAVGRK